MVTRATDRCIKGECPCEIASAVRHIYRRSKQVHELRPDVAQFAREAFLCLKDLVAERFIDSATKLGQALGAIFDVCVSLLYAEQAVHRGWLYCPVEPPASFYTYVKSCPRCGRVGRKDADNQGLVAHKPSSQKIGCYNALCTAAILSEFCQHTQNRWDVALDTSNSDVDMILTNESNFVLCEIKASPLVAFPLCVTHEEHLEEEVEGERRSIKVHTATDLHNWKSVHLSLFIHDANREIPVRVQSVEGQGVLVSLQEKWWEDSKDAVKEVISVWYRLMDGYASRWKVNSHLQWFTCGCGKPVDDSKNAPGLDRTDDIKKGLYQAIKLTESYRMKCVEQRVRVGIVSNIHPVRHYPDYLRGFEDALWTHESRLESDTVDQELWRRVRRSDLSPFYDMLFTFTQSWFRDPNLEKAFSIERLYRAMGGA